MSLTKQQKEESVKYIQDNLSSAVSVVFMSFDSLAVGEVNELRSNLHQAGGAMRVIPKRLLKIALANSKVNFDPAQQQGQIAVVWGADVTVPARTLNTFAKEHKDTIQLLAGTLEGNTLTFAEVTRLANLPTRQQLIGQLLSVMIGPSRGLVTVLTGVQCSVVYVLKAITDQKETSQ